MLYHHPQSIDGGQRVSQTVSTVDIAPTVLTALGVPPLPAAEGRDLIGFMRGAPPAGPWVAFSDFLDDRRVILANRTKLILRGINPTLFDLATDPREQRELPLESRPIALRYCRILLGQFLGSVNRARWLDANQQPSQALAGESAEMDETIRGQLEALGYAN
jgi:hypothetical protein